MFLDAINHVVFASSKKQMIKSHTQFYIARVTHINLREYTYIVRVLPYEPMSTYDFSVHFESAVPFSGRCCPKPTIICLIYLVPESVHTLSIADKGSGVEVDLEGIEPSSFE